MTLSEQIAAYGEGISLAAIGHVCGDSVHVLARRLRRAGVPIRSRGAQRQIETTHGAAQYPCAETGRTCVVSTLPGSCDACRVRRSLFSVAGSGSSLARCEDARYHDRGKQIQRAALR